MPGLEPQVGNMDHPIWEAMSRVLVTVMAAGIVALVGLQWSTSQEIATIRGDIGIIKTESKSDTRMLELQLTNSQAAMVELRARVAQLENMLGSYQGAPRLHGGEQ